MKQSNGGHVVKCQRVACGKVNNVCFERETACKEARNDLPVHA